MAVIKVDKDYYIDIDNNGNHEACFDLHKCTIVKDKDGNEKEVPQHKTVGHYSTVRGACKGIYKDMCIRKARKKDYVTLSEWIDICKETENDFEKILDRIGD